MNEVCGWAYRFGRR